MDVAIVVEPGDSGHLMTRALRFFSSLRSGVESACSGTTESHLRRARWLPLFQALMNVLCYWCQGTVAVATDGR